MNNYIDTIFNKLRNITLNAVGVDRDLYQLLADKDIGAVKSLMQNRDEEVATALREYDTETHKVNSRPNKLRKGENPYITEKLPRSRQRYINEVELFFLLGKPLKWKNNTATDANTDTAFVAFNQFLKELRFEVLLRQAKRLAGAETEAAIIFHYQNDNGKPSAIAKVISYSKGYRLRPLFDQWGTLRAFGYGYSIKKGTKVEEHLDIETPEFIFECKSSKIGWDVVSKPNPTGKINVIYIRQEKAWNGVQNRIDREEYIDSKAADSNNYFADPKLTVTADVINQLASRETVGELISVTGKDSKVEYLAPPEYSTMKETEKVDLNRSILFDTFTPDFSFDTMKGLGTLSGDALRRAMTLGYIKRDNLMEIYDEIVDRAKNLILAIMAKVTHPELATELNTIRISHEFTEPFVEDSQTSWTAISELYVKGVASLETVVKMLALTDAPSEEVERIRDNKLQNVMLSMRASEMSQQLINGETNEKSDNTDDSEGSENNG